MRSPVFPAAAALLLSACGPGEAAKETSPNVRKSAGSGESAAPAPAPLFEAVLPQPFRGVYDASREACAGPSDMRLTVTDRELRFHESIGKVRGVKVGGRDRITAEIDYQGEGETWQSVSELKLVDGGASLTITGEGDPVVRLRCPAEGR